MSSMSMEKIKLREKVAYGSGDLACNFIFSTVSIFLLIFYTDVFGLTPLQASTLFLVARIWDAINDPIMGMIVDKLNLKRGKYKPYVLIGAIPLALAGILCFTVPNFGSTGNLIYAYVTYIAVGMIYTFVNVPYGALTSAMTQDPIERTSISSIRMSMAMAGGLIVSMGIPMITGKFESPARGYQVAMLIYAILGVIFFMFCYFGTKERVEVPKSDEKMSIKDILNQLKLNKPLRILCGVFFVIFTSNTINSSAGMYYFTYNVKRVGLFGVNNMVNMGTMIVMILLTPMIVGKFGKKKTFLAGLLWAAIGSFIRFVIPYDNTSLIILMTAITAIGNGVTTGLLWGLVPDTIEAGELATGKRQGGIIYAVVGFFFKLGTAMGGIIPGFVFSLTGYVPNAEQTLVAMNGITSLISIVPGILLLIIFIIFRNYPLDEKGYMEIIEKLNQKGKSV